jgi:hypothetical protein
MNDRKSNNDTLIITKSKDVWCSMSLSETDTMSSRRTAKLIFYRDLLKPSLFKYTKIIIIYFDLAGVTGANKLRKRYPDKFFVKFQPKE